MPTCRQGEESLGTVLRHWHPVAALWPHVSQPLFVPIPRKGPCDEVIFHWGVSSWLPSLQAGPAPPSGLVGDKWAPPAAPAREAGGAGLWGCAGILSGEPSLDHGVWNPQGSPAPPPDLGPNIWPQIEPWPQAPGLFVPSSKGPPSSNKVILSAPLPPDLADIQFGTHLSNTYSVPGELSQSQAQTYQVWVTGNPPAKRSQWGRNHPLEPTWGCIDCHETGETRGWDCENWDSGSETQTSEEEVLLGWHWCLWVGVQCSCFCKC